MLCFFSLVSYSQKPRIDTINIISKPKEIIQQEKCNPNTNKLDEFINIWIGRPYMYGGTTLSGIDCSAFVQKLYQEVYDLCIPRTAFSQYKVMTKISKRMMNVGDILFFLSSSSPSGWRVAVYLGNDSIIHAANKKRGVVLDKLTQNVINRIHAVGRLIF